MMSDLHTTPDADEFLLNDFELDNLDPDLDAWINEEGGLTADALDFLHEQDINNGFV